MKSDHPPFFKQVSEKLISREFQESFIKSNKETLEEILTYIRSAFALLHESTSPSLNIKDLAYSVEASKNLSSYAPGTLMKIYEEILQDCWGNKELANRRSPAERVYEYWKIIGEKDITIHPEKHQLDFWKYRDELFTCIRPILAAYSMKNDALNKLELEVVGPEEKGNKKKKKDKQQTSLGDYQDSSLSKLQPTDPTGR
jgi:hypothetical protein